MSIALPQQLYSAQSVRAMDQFLIQQQGLSAEVLMKRAGRFAFTQLQQAWPAARQMVVLCGAGNNAGDGYVVAALAHARNWNVNLRWLADPESLQGAARAAWQYAQQEGVDMSAFDANETLSAEVLVDALLGTGLSKPVVGAYAQAIQWLNRQPAPVVALDMPSGVHADTGTIMGTAVQAALTATFVGLKFGLFTGAGRGCAGRVVFSDLDGDVRAAKLPVQALRSDYSALMANLGARATDSHKGNFGHLAVVGGDLGLSGAALIAAEAGLRAGSGMVSLVSRPLTAQIALTRRPEIMALGVDAGIDAQTKLSTATALVVGPGLGQQAWGEQLLAQSLACDLPTCFDADALNLLAHQHQPKLPASCVLTPHPAEAARLLKVTVADVQADRASAARALVQQTGAVVVLKGAGSLVAFVRGDDIQIRLIDAGNPGMASGGMGDCLAGIIGALLAQGMPAAIAAELGALVHAMAGDQQAEADGQRGLLATDLLASVRWLLNGIS